MIRVIQTNDKSLPRKQEGWRNSKSAVVPTAVNVKSDVSDKEIDEISDQLDSGQISVQNQAKCSKRLNNQDIKDLEINKYINNFIKQNGSVISKENKDTKKVILG